MLNLPQILTLVAFVIWMIGVEYRLWVNIRLVRLQQEQLTLTRQAMMMLTKTHLAAMTKAS